MKLSNEMRELIQAARELREAESRGILEQDYHSEISEQVKAVVDALNKWEQLP